MDKRLILTLILIGIFCVVFFLISLNFNKKTSKKKDISITKDSEELSEDKVFIKAIESTPNLILEQSETQPEQYNPKQMYFERIETLYEYFNFEEVEVIKEAIRIYIQENIRNDILDSKIIDESLTLGLDNINFKIKVIDNEKITATVSKNEDNTIKKIELS